MVAAHTVVHCAPGDSPEGFLVDAPHSLPDLRRGAGRGSRRSLTAGQPTRAGKAICAGGLGLRPRESSHYTWWERWFCHGSCSGLAAGESAG